MAKNLQYYLGLSYPITCHPVVDDQQETSYQAVIPTLPGVVASGATIDEAITQLNQAKKDWIKRSLAAGVRVPEPKDQEFSGRLLLRLPKSLHASLAAAAEADGVSLNTLIIERLAMMEGRHHDN